MAGLDEILDLIAAQQKQTEESMIKAAESRADVIKAEGQAKAEAAYKEHLEKAKAQIEKDYENTCASTDAEMKRKILGFKVSVIDDAIGKTVEKLRSLPEKDYFDLLLRLVQRHLQSDKGTISLCSRDLERMPSDFESRLDELARKAGGSICVSKEPADIEDGFILSYGLISENCSFSAILEAEKDGVRDTAARVLFGQVTV